jgi:hypothetical protein
VWSSSRSTRARRDRRCSAGSRCPGSAAATGAPTAPESRMASPPLAGQGRPRPAGVQPPGALCDADRVSGGDTCSRSWMTVMAADPPSSPASCRPTAGTSTSAIPRSPIPSSTGSSTAPTGSPSAGPPGANPRACGRRGGGRRMSSATDERAGGPCPSCGKRQEPKRVSHKLVGRRRECAAHTAHTAHFFVLGDDNRRRTTMPSCTEGADREP